jgi:hypothetical protein
MAADVRTSVRDVYSTHIHAQVSVISLALTVPYMSGGFYRKQSALIAASVR